MELNRKPSIILYKQEHISNESLQPLLYGLEEEGIPCTIEMLDGHSDVLMANLAAQASSLAVGVGVTTQSVTLTYKNIPSSHYVYRLPNYTAFPESLRALGINAARLVKGVPFSIDERLEVVF